MAETLPSNSPMERAYARDISGAVIRMGSVQLLSPGWDLNIEIDTLEPMTPAKVATGDVGLRSSRASRRERRQIRTRTLWLPLSSR